MDISTLTDVVESIADGVSISAPDRKIIFCNKAFQNITGYGEAEILGATLSFLQGPDRDMAMVETMNDCMNRGIEFSDEILNYRKDGEPFWNHMRIKPHFNEGGEIDFFIGIMRNITRRRAAEVDKRKLQFNLLEREEQIQAVSDHLSSALRVGAIGTFDYYIDEDKSVWSPELLEMCGASDEQFPAPADFFISRIDEADRPRFISLFEEAIANGTPYELTVKVHRYDAGYMYMQISAEVVGECLDRRITGVARDVTDNIETAELLTFESERFRIIADTVSDALWDYDLETGEWWLSPGWAERIGMEFDEGQANLSAWANSVNKADSERVSKSFVSALKSGTDTWSVEFPLKDEAGNKAEIAAKARLIRNSAGRVTRMLGNARNVTIEKRQQEGYSRSRALEAVGQLTGGVAHDFNNLLMVIQGNSELLSMSDLAEEDAESVSLINEASESAAQLTQRLLSFSGQSMLHSERVAMSEIIPNAVRLLEAGITESIEIKSSIPEGLWDVSVDANSLQQALVNLVINARDAMPKGGNVTISCENCSVDFEMAATQSDLTAGDYVLLSVTDTGQGIAPEHQSKVFEPFFTTKDVGKGTGLGLSTVYGFANQSDGHLTIYSELGQGTSVSLYLPRSDEGDASLDAPEYSGAQPELQKGKRVLIVEDQPQVMRQVEKFISSLGYDSMSASDGHEALALIESGETFDLMLSDVIMPNQMNGPELAQQVRQKAPETKILFTSGYPAAAFGELGLPELADQPLLRKPYKLADLRTALQKALKA